jgi:pilus assembly protein Flp/PilA
VSDYPSLINARGETMRHPFEILKDKRGATAVEYGLILALIFLAMIGGVVAVGQVTSGMWNNVSSEVRNNT